jgi:LacI family transcriptional regulator
MAKNEANSIYAVARHAGVSSSTVSRVLGGRTDLVAVSTRERVVAAAQSLGYRPIGGARPGHRAIDCRGVRTTTPQPAMQRCAVPDRRGQLGLFAVVCNTDYDATRATEHLAMLADHQVAGVILTGQDYTGKEDGNKYKEQIDRMSSRGILAIGLGESTNLPLRVSYNNRALGKQLADHLLDLGHRQFVFIRVAPSLRAMDTASVISRGGRRARLRRVSSSSRPAH